MTLLKRGEGFEKSLAAIAMLSIVALAAILVFLLTQALKFRSLLSCLERNGIRRDRILILKSVRFWWQALLWPRPPL